jgi:uncharacterized protein
MMTKNHLIAFASGLVFALGLGLSGMTNPNKVIGFLDLFGAWDPSLLFVMGGAIAIHMPATAWARRQGMFLPAVPCAGQTNEPVGGVAHAIDRPLVAGAAIFGIGWALSGYCPGPAVVATGAGNPSTLLFFAAMLLGIGLRSLQFRRKHRREHMFKDATAHGTD